MPRQDQDDGYETPDDDIHDQGADQDPLEPLHPGNPDDEAPEAALAEPAAVANARNPAVILRAMIDAGDWRNFGDVITTDDETDIHMTLEPAGLAAHTTLFQYAFTKEMPLNIYRRFVARGLDVGSEIWIAGALQQNWELVGLMLQIPDANINVSWSPAPPHPSAGITTLDMAIRKREWRIAKALIARGADVEAASRHFGYPGIVLSILAQPIHIIEQLFARLDREMDCPVSMDVMLDPVRLVTRQASGTVTELQSYDRTSINKALRDIAGFRSPLTRAPILGITTAFDRAKETEAAVQQLGLQIAEMLEAHRRALTRAPHPGAGAISPERPVVRDRRQPDTPQPKRARRAPPSPHSP